MSLDVVSLVGGGVIGGAVSALWRLTDVPRGTRQNDQAVEALEEAFANWVGDRHEQLGEESTRLRVDLGREPSPPGPAGTGLFAPTPEDVATTARYQDWHGRAHDVDVSVARLRTDALRSYRDERLRVRSSVAETYASEGWLESAYRLVRRQPRRQVSESRDLVVVVDSWRRLSHVDTESSPVTPSDPSTRTDADLRLTVRGTGP